MKVYLYILNTLADWEIGFLMAELNCRRYFKNKNTDLEIVKIASSEKSIKTMGGMEIKPDLILDSVEFSKDDLLILPGADTWMEEENRKILDISKHRIEKDYKVAAICGATIGLAKAGALDKKMHTSNDKDYLKFICPEYKGENLYQEKPAFCDKNLITASGIAPLEFAYEVIKSLDVFHENTLEAWYNLYVTKDSKYFFDLINSVQN